MSFAMVLLAVLSQDMYCMLLTMYFISKACVSGVNC